MIQIRFTKIPIQFRHFPRDPERKKQTIAIFASLWLASCGNCEWINIKYTIYCIQYLSKVQHEADFDRKRVSNSGNLLMNRTVLSWNALAFGSLNVVWFWRIWNFLFCLQALIFILYYSLYCTYISKRQAISSDRMLKYTCDPLWPL